MTRTQRRLFALIISGQKPDDISLRLLDYFVVNYCRRFPVHVERDGLRQSIYGLYRTQLLLHGKQSFDAFKRKKTEIRYRNIVTTAAQLHFFQWVFRYDIYNMLLEHKVAVRAAMAGTIPSPQQNQKDVASELRLTFSC